jgi:DNA invertase Pin-like site-specific DNA recombinase
MATIGYARVSTWDQNLDLQLDALKAVGAEKVFTDQVSGSKADRPGLNQCLEYLRAGDVLVVWKLDRLGRSTQHLVNLMADFADREVELVVTTLGIDTRTPAGKLVMRFFAAFAEFERDLIIERTKAGLESARARGRVGGRKPALTDGQALVAQQMYDELGPDGKRAHTVQEIADVLRVKRSTVYGYLAAPVSSGSAPT